MTNRGSELQNVVQMSCLSRRVTIQASVKSMCQWFVIRGHMKMSALKKMAEMPDGKVHS